MAAPLVVVDASAVIAVITEEPHRYPLIEATKGSDLVAPATLPAEIGNAFSAMFKRGRISLDAARSAVRAFSRIPVRLVGIELIEAIELSHRLDVYAYDAYVIACCLRHRAPLATLDQGQRDAALRAGAQALELKP